MSDELQDFVGYASAFEDAFAADDWGLVDVCFDEDIVWATGGLPAPAASVAHGRKNAAAAVKKSVDTFDRRFDRREPIVTKGPLLIPGGVHLEWLAIYTRDGLPPFELRGEEWDLFLGGKLMMHYERIHNAAEAFEFLIQHHAAMRPPR